MEWAKLILSNLTGIAAIITLVLSLVTYVRKATKEKNWSNLLATVTKYMEIDSEGLDIQITQTESEGGNGTVPVLCANIPVRDMKTRS